MENWQEQTLTELLIICTDLSKSYAPDRAGVAKKLRQIAFSVDLPKNRAYGKEG
ncbi:hypothetical protein [Aphanothece hegewaldii]|uniref:hypothetical protein n=1 Tax=Aphanothece hegewaldii TaxID=1521625 RepID=UPI0015E690C2|nr:hypothetical protein [Aphanothece hegewaldii]